MHLHLSTDHFRSTLPPPPCNVALGYEEEIIVAKLVRFALTTHHLAIYIHFFAKKGRKKNKPPGGLLEDLQKIFEFSNWQHCMGEEG